MISISTPTFDVAGSEVLNPDIKSDIDTVERRVSRTKTLDGGVTIDDMGFSWGDVTLKLLFSALSEATAENIRRLTSSYTNLIVSTKDGVFSTSPSRFDNKEGVVTLTLLIKEKISG